MGSGILLGAAAGAAGTAALNAATYLDMVLRGRGASDTPQQTVKAIEGRLPVTVPGRGEIHENRVEGLGSLSGIVTGAAIGAAVGLLRRTGVRPSLPFGAVITGLGAMAATGGAMAALRVTDARDWSAADWLSDLIPHLIYGAVTYAVLEAFDRS